MKAILNAMKKRDSGIPESTVRIFEEISRTCERSDREKEYLSAMEKNLTQQQRLRVCEQSGSCNGTGMDKERKAFALDHAHLPFGERLEQYAKAAGHKPPVSVGDDCFTIPFSCRHGYYKHAPKGEFAFSESLLSYFERCAGGRLYEFQKALGVKLKIKAVDISPLDEDVSNPVLFTFELC